MFIILFLQFINLFLFKYPQNFNLENLHKAMKLHINSNQLWNITYLRVGYQIGLGFLC